jgi:hypothetical protein
MSVAYSLQPDQSAPLAKRFAHLASSYFDQPENAKKPDARVPLENLFRILEMRRYEAFSDEPSGGIVSLEQIKSPLELQQQEPWHIGIKDALDEAMTGSFGETPPAEAIQQIQAVLRWLASGKNVPSDATIATTRDFLRLFEQRLR